MDLKEKKNHIKQLKSNKEYDKIYEIYGRKAYIKYVPSKYIRQDIKKLMQEGKFEDIYLKYGKDAYNDRILAMQQKDVSTETGSKFRGVVNRIGNILKRRVAVFLAIGTVALPPAAHTMINLQSNIMTEKNAIEYAEQIEKYDSKINTYAEEIRQMNLSDIQVVMKVMSDMWENIDGYGNPKEEVFGFERLNFLEDGGVGVCRHMADDVTAKLNAINPEYNARNVICYLETGKGYRLSNIERSTVEDNATYVDENEEPEEEKQDLLTAIIGNHRVTAIDLPNENITLILDPTNPGIGVYKDGQIHMFSTEDGKGVELRSMADFSFGTSILQLSKDYAKSFFSADKSIEELEKEFGVEAQNEALKELEKLEANSQKFGEQYKVEIDYNKIDLYNETQRENEENER
ncbi:MAG: hypothetical protein LBL91_02750 [Lachnospiraceae bacterium]|jgi:hypothetical protein|nr:hypothetical protein [Lachnospiraceae bacterium]